LDRRDTGEQLSTGVEETKHTMFDVSLVEPFIL